MVMKKFVKKALAASVAAVTSLGTGAVWATAQDEVDKQVAKLLGDAVAKRVASAVIAEQTAGAAAGGLNNVYASYGRNTVGFNAGGVNSTSNTDILVGGYDRNLTDKLVLGAAVNGSRTSTSNNTGVAAAGFSGSGIQPYAAYVFTKNFFVIGKLTYGEGSGGGTSVNFNGGGISLNGLGRWDNFVLKGRAEVNGSRARSTTAGLTTNSNSTSTALDGEAGYFFQPNLYGFVGYQATNASTANSRSDYARIGLEYSINKDAAVSVSYEGKVGDNQPTGTSFSANTWTIAGRIRF